MASCLGLKFKKIDLNKKKISYFWGTLVQAPYETISYRKSQKPVGTMRIVVRAVGEEKTGWLPQYRELKREAERMYREEKGAQKRVYEKIRRLEGGLKTEANSGQTQRDDTQSIPNLGEKTFLCRGIAVQWNIIRCRTRFSNKWQCNKCFIALLGRSVLSNCSLKKQQSGRSQWVADQEHASAFLISFLSDKNKPHH